jgi:hypothetical protein
MECPFGHLSISALVHMEKQSEVSEPFWYHISEFRVLYVLYVLLRQPVSSWYINPFCL